MTVYRRHAIIIILGPDGSGKTILARELELSYYHFDNNSKYEDYLKPLCSLEMTDAVLDRHIICEYPYHQLLNRKFAFTMKQWHNIILLTLTQNPLVILCTHKPAQNRYAKDELMPYDQWDQCLRLYRHFLSTNFIRYIEYDYGGPITIGALEIMHEKHKSKTDWWRPMWKEGYGCIGSMYPKVLLVAERIGPNNVNSLPFEVGPTGLMFSEMLTETKTPLGKFVVTNMVKSHRRDTRSPNKTDLDLLHEELVNLRPDKVIFMGNVSRVGIKVARMLSIPHETMVHFGYYNYKSMKATELHVQWRSIMEIIP